jgi:hypothetical protein
MKFSLFCLELMLKLETVYVSFHLVISFGSFTVCVMLRKFAYLLVSLSCFHLKLWYQFVLIHFCIVFYIIINCIVTIVINEMSCLLPLLRVHPF